jgi:membrane-bound metal-dependent hydrolase YbcI (DUF457 family)
VNGTTHAVTGAAAGAWAAVALRPAPGVALAGIVVSAVAALVPDTDHPSSRLVRSFGLTVRWGTRRWCVGPGPLLCAAVRVVSHAATGRRHRGLSHSLVFALLVGGLTGGVSAWWVPLSHAVHLGLVCCLGVTAALVGDLVTRAGLDHLLWPSQRRVAIPKRWRIRSGGLVERWLVLPAVSVAAAVGTVAVLAGWGVPGAG